MVQRVALLAASLTAALVLRSASPSPASRPTRRRTGSRRSPQPAAAAERPPSRQVQVDTVYVDPEGQARRTSP